MRVFTFHSYSDLFGKTLTYFMILFQMVTEEGSIKEIVNTGSGDDNNNNRDDYNNYKRLLQTLEYLKVQEDYIKDELQNLKKEYRHAQEEVRILHFNILI